MLIPGRVVHRAATWFGHPSAGYAAAMSPSESPEQQAEQNADTKPGPASPRTEGAEAPTPPGGPLRQDDAGQHRRGGHDDDASASPAANESAEEAGGHTIPDRGGAARTAPQG